MQVKDSLLQLSLFICDLKKIPINKKINIRVVNSITWEIKKSRYILRTDGFSHSFPTQHKKEQTPFEADSAPKKIRNFLVTL